VFLSAHPVDVILVDVAVPIRDLLTGLQGRRRRPPLIACGTGADTAVAQAALKAGASEYLPLSASAEEVAALITALAREDRESSRQAGTSSKPN
jgi:two-component system response regulator FlrC